MNTVIANSTAEWRSWLAENSRSTDEVWLVIHHKNSGVAGIRHHEAVEQALCFGWIDGLQRKHDAHSARQRFTPRRRGSTWSEVNRERAARMTELGLMTPHGQAMIDLAKATGRWSVTIPDDVRATLDGNESFRELAPSSQRLTLEWIATAKRPETRRRRLERTLQQLG